MHKIAQCALPSTGKESSAFLGFASPYPSQASKGIKLLSSLDPNKPMLRMVLNSYLVQLGKAELDTDQCRKGGSNCTPCRGRKECDRPCWTPEKTIRHQVAIRISLTEIYSLQADVLLYKIKFID